MVIIGAGPCGLACGRELARLGHADWTIYERTSHAGGHASSVVDASGFTWDLGGHVVFSHFGEFDALLDEALGDDVYEHERSSFVRVDGRWVPYPFQNNLRYLEPDVVYECLARADRAPAARRRRGTSPPGWRATFGDGITRHFMRPYNDKVWATPPEEMSADWIAERVSVVDYRRALANVVLERDDGGWGPNNTFRFPRAGGHRRDLPPARRAARRSRALRQASSSRVDAEARDARASPTGARTATTRSSRRCRSTAWSASLDDCPADASGGGRRARPHERRRRRRRVRASTRRRPLVALLPGRRCAVLPRDELRQVRARERSRRRRRSGTRPT